MAIKRKALFVTIPRPLLWTPPIRHRHSDDNKGFLHPFEFAVATGIVVLARKAMTKQRHQQSLVAGRERAEQTWQYAKEAKLAFMPSIKDEMADGYRDNQMQQRKEGPPAVIMVDASRYAILRYARLATDGRNMRRLEVALARLCHPVGPDSDPLLPLPLLQSCKQLRSTRLRLRVSGLWLRPPFARVPMPLPTRSPTALALFLFVQTVKTSVVGKSAMRLDRVCEVLGIPMHWGPAACRRALANALKVVNRHLRRLPAAALEQAKVNVPGSYEMLIDDDDFVRFNARERQLGEEGKPDDDAPMWVGKMRKHKSAKAKPRHAPVKERSSSSHVPFNGTAYLNGERVKIFGHGPDYRFRLPDGTYTDVLPDGVEWREGRR